MRRPARTFLSGSIDVSQCGSGGLSGNNVMWHVSRTTAAPIPAPPVGASVDYAVWDSIMLGSPSVGVPIRTQSID